VNRARKAANLLRAHGEPAFRAWIHEQPCVVCGRIPSDPAHLTNGGMSRKDAVARTVPLCATIVATGYSGHHAEYDGGKRSFRAKYAHLDLPALAAETQRRWTLHREAA
jgi:hypothetical protein